MPAIARTVHTVGEYRYIDEGPPTHYPPVVLLHGMLGDLSNWAGTIDALAVSGYRVLVPVLPVYDMPLRETTVSGLVDFLRRFLNSLGIERSVLIGNSLGGHVAILYTHRYQSEVSALVLSGSSGIYEVAMGTGMPRRHSREFIQERAALTFYDPAHATDELVNEMCDIVNDRTRVTRLIKMARATKDENVSELLAGIELPTLLVWGRDDTITPPDVGEQFRRLLPNAELEMIDRCGHAPMIEHPDVFNRITLAFLHRTIGIPSPFKAAS